MPSLALISHASRHALCVALVFSTLTLPLFVSAARAEGGETSPIPGGPAVVAAPRAPLIVAADPAPPPAPAAVASAESAPAPIAVMLFRGDGGVAIIPGRPVGAYGNVGFDTLFNADRRRLKPVGGVSYAWEFFGVPGRGGGGFNLELVGGLRSPRVFALLGAGVNVFTFGLEKGGGGGILSPRASARIGFVMGSFHLGAVAQVQHRWQWGSEDLNVVTMGLAFGGMWEEEERNPSR